VRGGFARHPTPGLWGRSLWQPCHRGFNRRAYSPTSNQSAKRDPVRHRWFERGDPSLGVSGRDKRALMCGGPDETFATCTRVRASWGFT
jgi:hypothetical protein